MNTFTIWRYKVENGDYKSMSSRWLTTPRFLPAVTPAARCRTPIPTTDCNGLASATGTDTGADSKSASYTLAMGYDNMHRITSKSQHLPQDNVQFNGHLFNTIIKS